MRLKFPGRPAMNVTSTVERADRNELLTWRGHLVAPWFFTGLRKFEIEPVDADHVRVTHVEDLSGGFAPVFALLMGGPVQRSHDALNEALRARAEST